MNKAWAHRANDGQRSITVLGATGSVGSSTLDLISRTPNEFSVDTLTANTDVEKLADAARRHGARLAVIADPSLYRALQLALSGTGVEAAAGPRALVEAAERPVDCVLASIMGAAGLAPSLAAARQGRRLALANKECLVAAGDVFMRVVSEYGTELIPVDSEHSGVFQALSGQPAEAIDQIQLTASGGPFRGWERTRLIAVTPEQALRHPNWSMGRKITVDSATLMNKGLELIEAYHLFPVSAEQIGVVVHPQSIVHCLVSFRDGSVLAHMSAPDMRTPIACALSWPRRMASPTERLDLARLGQLTFEPPDETTFPALGHARAALARAGTAPAVLNAANEIAVEAFLGRRIGFLDIADIVGEVLNRADATGEIGPSSNLDDALAADAAGRRLARDMIRRVA